MISKWRAFRAADTQSRRFLRAFRKSGRLSEIAAVADQFRPSPLVAVFNEIHDEYQRQTGGRGMPPNPQALERAAQTASSEALTLMERRMTWLATIAQSPPSSASSAPSWASSTPSTASAPPAPPPCAPSLPASRKPSSPPPPASSSPSPPSSATTSSPPGSASSPRAWTTSAASSSTPSRTPPSSAPLQPPPPQPQTDADRRRTF